jgi:hypothetical protein
VSPSRTTDRRRTTKPPPTEVGGGSRTAWRRCAHGSRGWRADGTRSGLPLAGARPVARPRRVALVGHLGGAAITRASERTRFRNGPGFGTDQVFGTDQGAGVVEPRCGRSKLRQVEHVPVVWSVGLVGWSGRLVWSVAGGAAGSRTRVPRSRRCGLYVRRFRMISDVVLRSQTASTSIPPAGVPIGPGGPGVRVEPRVVAPVPLRGVRGGTSRRVRPREPSHRWHLKVPARFVEVARASSARSPGDGLTTVETMSAPGWWRASARCSCQATGRVALAGPPS